MLSKPLKWKTPKRYLDANKEAVGKEVLGFFVEKVVSCLIEATLGAYTYKLFKEGNWPLFALTAAIFLLLLNFIYTRIVQGRVISIASEVELRRNFISTGLGTLSWSNINRYQLMPVEGFPDLRAIEISFRRGDRTQMLPLVFDPKDVDEREVMAFMKESIASQYEQRKKPRGSLGNLDMGDISVKRILIALTVVIAVMLTAAGGFWVYMNYFTKKNGGPGTKIVDAGNIPEHQRCVFSMPGDTSRESKPLEELLPSDWKRMEHRIAVDKSSRILDVYAGKRRVKSYFIALGYRPEGPKAKRDDGKTPEGIYYVCSRNPRSKFELSLLLSYPGKVEADNGFKNGLINEAVHDSIASALNEKRTPPQDTALGSYICIHGGGIGELASDFSKAHISDWTAGCIAMRSEDIEEVYDFADPGTMVEIKP